MKRGVTSSLPNALSITLTRLDFTSERFLREEVNDTLSHSPEEGEAPDMEHVMFMKESLARREQSSSVRTHLQHIPADADQPRPPLCSSTPPK